MKIAKTQKGITIVALIITIIILLILVAIPIRNMQDDGIVSYAKGAKNNYNIKQVKEQIKLACILAGMNGDGKIDIASLRSALGRYLEGMEYQLINVGANGYIVDVDGVQYKLNSNADVEALQEGSPIKYAGDLSKNEQYDGLTAQTAFRLACIEDLVEWTDNYGIYQNKYIKLEKTLDFENPSSYNNYLAKTTDINGNGEIEVLIQELTTGTGFKPINRFEGIFEGNNEKILNIYENRTAEAGLINRLSGGTIQNLELTGKISTMTKSSAAGGLVAIGAGIINNCTVNCIVNSDNYAGGILGRCAIEVGNVNINECKIYGEIKGAKYAGGVTGYTEKTMEILNTSNFANIYSATAGGLIGDLYKASNIYNSYNEGTINGTSYSGGLVGNTSYRDNIVNCYNKGFVKGDNQVAGLIGYSYAPGNLLNCVNVGEVVSNSNQGTAGVFYNYGLGPTSIKTYFLDNVGYAVVTKNIVDNNNQTNEANRKYIRYSKNDMQSQAFVDTLNAYVDTYNSNTENTVTLKRWKVNVGDYPTFE